MRHLTLNTKIESLPPDLKKEVVDFVDFLLSKSRSDRKVAAKFGSAKGKIKMTEDFDDPLEDFNEYI